jgi:L-fuconolactonase
MIGIAQTYPSVLGVVGWVDFSARNVADLVAHLARNAVVKSLRPMVQDYADVDWLSRQEQDPAFEALLRHDLAFDALVKPRNLKSLIHRLDRHPDLRVVIDHCAKPAIRDREFKTWAEPMSVLAGFPNVWCKLSGLITEAEPGWSRATLKPYVEHVLSIFGAERVMFGSDWPVVLLQGSYDDWLGAAVDLTSHLAASEQAAIFGGNAARFYRVSANGR